MPFNQPTDVRAATTALPTGPVGVRLLFRVPSYRADNNPRGQQTGEAVASMKVGPAPPKPESRLERKDGMRRFAAHGAVSLLGLAWLLGTASWAEAGMVLSPSATADGFTLSTFASGFPNTGFNGVGPVGIAFPNSGGVMVTSYANGLVIRFPTDTDGQSYPGASQVSGYNHPAGLVNDGGHIYMAVQGGGNVWQLNDNGTINHHVTSLGGATGIAVNPTNGHLFVSAGDLFDINPSNGATVDYSAHHSGIGSGTDGLTFSPDGKTLYAALFGQGIQAIDVATGHQIFFTPISGSDGTALGTGTLAGELFANTNFGQVIEISLASPQTHTLIASGGSRGDFVTVDPNGTLLLTQTDRILRLTAPAGGGFAGAAPEPASLTLAGLGGLALLGYGWRRRKA